MTTTPTRSSLAEARADASGALLAEIELLRAQVREHGNRLEAARYLA